MLISSRSTAVWVPRRALVEFDLRMHTARAGGAVLRLPRLQLLMLMKLARSSPGVVSRDALHSDVYGLRADGGPDLKIIDVAVCGIRRAIKATGAPIAIGTSYGVGYWLEEAAPHGTT